MAGIAGVLQLAPLWLVVLQQPVYPSGGNGFAAAIVGAFLGLGILVLFMIWITRRPRRRG